jgi:CheY-like chemotaxis protein
MLRGILCWNRGTNMARILIADNHEDTIFILTAEIEAEGHDVITAMTGRDAYDSIVAEQPDLVFVGPSLAIHDGYETCSLVRGDPDVPERLPILMLGAEELDRRRMERAGITDSFPREHGAADVRELLSRLIPA